MTDFDARSECVICNVLEIFGDKWTLLVIRDLFFFNKHEFKEFLASPEGIATNVLTDRLKRLSTHEIIREVRHPQNRSRKLYYLTEKGKGLFPILAEMAKWGEKWLPDLPAMQGLYNRLRTNPQLVRDEIFQQISQWESENILAAN
ncbi:MAG: helix-turn-helix transcriptional regulator [Candidatus Obscuribacterales bacterium]|nr:helix-turn-helix transcriptional regulator [Candidatus Obscuribacterales bacterium]